MSVLITHNRDLTILIFNIIKYLCLYYSEIINKYYKTKINIINTKV